MLVSVRLTYILIDASHYSSHGQVILIINSLASLHFFDRPRVTLSNRDRTRPNETFIYNILLHLQFTFTIFFQTSCSYENSPSTFCNENLPIRLIHSQSESNDLKKYLAWLEFVATFIFKSPRN